MQNSQARFRFAICNEIFQNAPFDIACHTAAETGFSGIELAPNTLAEDATLLDASERQRLRSTIRESGLEFVGLHWLLVSPPGLHVTSIDPEIRRRTWDYVRRSVELCAALSESNRDSAGLIVLGSPKQRSTRGGMTAEQGAAILTEEFSALAPYAENAGVKLLIEALPAAETNVVNTLAEAAALVSSVGSPSVATMFDVHNAADETEPHEALIARYLPILRHVHVNEPDGREPGMGEYDFAPLLRSLAAGGYSGWVSVESFDFSRPGREIAERALNCLRERASQI